MRAKNTVDTIVVTITTKVPLVTSVRRRPGDLGHLGGHFFGELTRPRSVPVIKSGERPDQRGGGHDNLVARLADRGLVALELVPGEIEYLRHEKRDRDRAREVGRIDEALGPQLRRRGNPHGLVVRSCARVAAWSCGELLFRDVPAPGSRSSNGSSAPRALLPSARAEPSSRVLDDPCPLSGARALDVFGDTHSFSSLSAVPTIDLYRYCLNHPPLLPRSRCPVSGSGPESPSLGNRLATRPPLAGAEGLEPTTCGFGIRCSTN